MNLFDAVYRARRNLEEKWERYYNVWAGIRDIAFYEGYSYCYLSQVRKIIEQGIVNFQQLLIPQKYPFRVKLYDSTYASYADTAKKFTIYQLDQINIKFQLDLFLRQLLIYGTSPVKTVWIRKTKKFRVNGREQEYVVANHTSFLPVDLLDFFVYPEAAPSMDEVQAVFERKFLSFNYLKQKEEEGIYRNVEQLKHKTRDVLYRERLQKMGFTTYTDIDTPIEIIEAWFDYERESYVATFSRQPEVLLRFKVNPYWHKEKPYLVARYAKTKVNQFYGSGLVEQVQRLQYALNDFANLAMDCMIYALNPIVQIDPARVFDRKTQLLLAPGAFWDVEPDAVRPFIFPDVSGAGLNAMTMLKTSIEEMAGLGPTPLLAVPRETATEAGMIAREANIFLAEKAKIIEEEVFNPFLRRNHILTQQFLSREDIMIILGQLGVHYQDMDATLEALLSQQDFRWIASSEATTQAVTAKQMVDFLGVIANIGALQDPTFRINIPLIVKKLWREGFGFHDTDEIIIDMKAKGNPVDENALFLAGKLVSIKPNDDDLHHMEIHIQILPMAQDPVIVERIREHIAEHEEAYRMKHPQPEPIPPQQALEQGHEPPVEEEAPIPPVPEEPQIPQEEVPQEREMQ